jgi:hypothetical protein
MEPVDVVGIRAFELRVAQLGCRAVEPVNAEERQGPLSQDEFLGKRHYRRGRP